MNISSIVWPVPAATPRPAPLCRRASPAGCFGPYLQAVLADLRGGLSAEQATDPAVRRRPLRARDLHRHDLQAGTAVGRRPGSPVQRTGGRGPLTPSRRTSTRPRGESGSKKVWLWATVTPPFTVFTIADPQRRCRPGLAGKRGRNRSSAVTGSARTRGSWRDGDRFVGPIFAAISRR